MPKAQGLIMHVHRFVHPGVPSHAVDLQSATAELCYDLRQRHIEVTSEEFGAVENQFAAQPVPELFQNA